MSETQQVQTEIAQYVPIKQAVAELKALNSSLVFDYASKTGNKEARSHIHKLRGSRGALERARKEAKSWVIAIGKDVDAQADAIDTEIQDMIKLHLDPIEEIERIEKERTEKAFALLTAIVEMPSKAEGLPSQEIMAMIEPAKAIIITADEYHEFYQQAVDAKESAIAKLGVMAERAKAAEEEALRIARERDELNLLRAQVEARAAKDREEEIRNQAILQARIDAEATATAERNRVAREAQAQQQAAEAREQKLKADAVLAEQNAALAIKQAQADAEAKIAAADAARRTQEAALAEEAAAEAAIEAARKANREHRLAVHTEIMNSLTNNGIGDDAARAVINLMIAGKVSRVQINY